MSARHIAAPVPAEADVRLVHYEEPAADFNYLTKVLSQPLDVALCPSLKWGCRYLRLDHRRFVDRTSDNKVIADLLSGKLDHVKEALAAINGVVLRDRWSSAPTNVAFLRSAAIRSAAGSALSSSDLSDR
jgi:hypothetical protein